MSIWWYAKPHAPLANALDAFGFGRVFRFEAAASYYYISNAANHDLPCCCSTSSARDSRSSRLLAFSRIKYGNLLNGHAEPLVFVR